MKEDIYDKDIAIVIQNEAQYYAVEPLLKYLHKSKRYSYDIFVNPLNWENTGHKEISNATKKIIIKNGFKPIYSNESDTTYKLVLGPYADLINVKYKYIVQYLYAIISAKPNPVYKPEFMRYFHGILCHSLYESNILNVYAKTHVVDSLKYIRNSWHQRPKVDQKTILFIPSYDSDIESSFDILSQARLEGYRVIVKLHHGTQYLHSENYKAKILGDYADKVVGSEVSLDELFNKSTVVLCNNTGSIFEAMYVGVPVILAGNDFNKHKLGDLDTLQYKLQRKEIIPVIKKFEEDLFSEGTLNKIAEIQNSYANLLFGAGVNSGLRGWLDVIESYINDTINQEYISLHDYYIKYLK